MENKLIIVGAGMSGLLAGAMNPGSIVYEAGPERESHQALFRCRSNKIGKFFGIPFKKVTVHKAVWLDDTEVPLSPRIIHMYSKKLFGTISQRSISSIDTVERYIPPIDFLDRLRNKCNIIYNTGLALKPGLDKPETVISTIPMDKVPDHPQIEFNKRSIFVNRIKIPNCNSYATIYFPAEEYGFYRASLDGDNLIVESLWHLDQYDIAKVCRAFHIPTFQTEDQITNYEQKYGKIFPIDERIRTDFITKLSINRKIYSLGRYATWRPKVMLDDVFDDVFVIRRLMEGGIYESLKYNQEEV